MEDYDEYEEYEILEKTNCETCTNYIIKKGDVKTSATVGRNTREPCMQFGCKILNVEAICYDRFITRERSVFENGDDMLKFMIFDNADNAVKIYNYRLAGSYLKRDNGKVSGKKGGFLSFSHFLKPYSKLKPLLTHNSSISN
jgi:hypothetical protein